MKLDILTRVITPGETLWSLKIIFSQETSKAYQKGLEVHGFGVVKYSARSESRHMIVLRDQAYYVPGLLKDLRIIYPQGLLTLEGYTGALIDHFHDNHDSYKELNLEGYKPGWHKEEHL